MPESGEHRKDLQPLPKLDDAVNEIIAVCAGVPEKERKFFREFIDRMKDFRRRLHTNHIRIAVIGITSSGKSTLLNRMLGCDLLPTLARPSSGRQVLCGYADTPRAEILFEDESRKTEIYETFPEIREKLWKYGDEGNNKRNCLGVKEIHVFSPLFCVDHDLLFVDTPGLDAYGLEYHEKITLNLVLPTVDMVLYLTTTNDSDQRNRDYINAIDETTSSLKPLILVQNKIDAVTAKTTGMVKTVQEVRQDYYNKLKRLLEGTNNDSVRHAAIVQVSAKKESRTGRFIGFDRLNAALLKAAAGYRTRQSEVNRFQLNRDLKDLEQKIQAMTQDARQKEAIRRQREKVIGGQEEKVNKITGEFQSFKSVFAGKLIDLENSFTLLLQAIDREYAIGVTSDIPSGIGPTAGLDIPEILIKIGKKHFVSFLPGNCYRRPENRLSDEIKNRKSSFESEMEAAQKSFFEYTSANRQWVHAACESLNLDEKQVYQEEFGKKVDISIPDCLVEEEVERKKRVRKNWLRRAWNRILSLFGRDTDDYETVRVKTKVDKVNVREQRQEIKKSFKKLLASVSENYSGLERSIDHCMDCLQSEVRRRRRELEDQLVTDISSATGENVLKTLRKFISDDISPKPFSPDAQDDGDAPHGADEDRLPAEDDSFQWYDPSDLAYYLFRLAQLHRFDPHRSLVRDMIERSGKSEISIFAWKDEKIEDFEDIFIPEEFRSAVHKINIDSGTDNSQPLPDLPRAENQLVFFLLNADQSGSAQNFVMDEDSSPLPNADRPDGVQNRPAAPEPRIAPGSLYRHRCAQWLKQAAASGRVVWCMDSVRGAIDDDPDKDSFIEVFCGMERIVKDFHKDTEPFDIMALDVELSYSVLLHELHFHPEQLESEVDRQNFIKNMSEFFHFDNDQKHRFGGYLNQYLDRKETTEESSKK